MDEPIELSIDSPNGLIDCRIEQEITEDGSKLYSVTILYPNISDGFSRSEIFVHTMIQDPVTHTYTFVDDEKGILPKINSLEPYISEAIIKQSS